MSNSEICPVCGSNRFRIDMGRRYCIRCGIELDAIDVYTRRNEKVRSKIKVKRVERTIKVIRILAEHLDIPNSVYELSIDISREAISNLDKYQRLSPYLIAIISLKIASIKLNKDIRIAKLMDTTKKLFNINFSRKKLNRKIAEVLEVFEGRFKIYPMDTEIHIEDAIDKIFKTSRMDIDKDLYEEVKSEAINILNRIRERMNRRYSPRVLASISILLAWNKIGKMIYSDEYKDIFNIYNVCKHLDISPYTVRKRLRDIINSGIIPEFYTINRLLIQFNRI